MEPQTCRQTIDLEGQIDFIEDKIKGRKKTLKSRKKSRLENMDRFTPNEEVLSDQLGQEEFEQKIIDDYTDVLITLRETKKFRSL